MVVGGLTRQEAAEKLEREIRYPFDTAFRFTYEGKTWSATAQELGFHPQTDVMTKAAFDIGRNGGLLDQISSQINAILHGVTIQPVFLFDERVAFNNITKMAEQIDTPMDDPSIVLQGSEVVIVPGKSGRLLDRQMTMNMLQIYAQNLQSAEIELPVIVLEPTEANLGEQKQVLDNLLSRDFVLYTNDERGVLTAGSIPAEILAGMIDFEPVVTDGSLTIDMEPKLEPFYSRILEIGSAVYRQARDPKFLWDNYNRSMRLLQHGESGKELDMDKSLENMPRNFLNILRDNPASWGRKIKSAYFTNHTKLPQGAKTFCFGEKRGLIAFKSSEPAIRHGRMATRGHQHCLSRSLPAFCPT